MLYFTSGPVVFLYLTGCPVIMLWSGFHKGFLAGGGGGGGRCCVHLTTPIFCNPHYYDAHLCILHTDQ